MPKTGNTKATPKILMCVDGSMYTEHTIAAVAPIAQALGAQVNILHVLPEITDYNVTQTDHTGLIDMGIRQELLEELVKIDEERAKIDQKKGRLVLNHAEAALHKLGITKIEKTLYKGRFAEVLTQFMPMVDLVFVGKRGAHGTVDSLALGSNLEKVIRSAQIPVYVVSRYNQPITEVLIAYDGEKSAQKAVDFACKAPFLKKATCHLVAVGAAHKEGLAAMAKQLTAADLSVHTHLLEGDVVTEVTNYVKTHNIGLLLAGAYNHSALRRMFMGSVTTALIKECPASLLLFR